MLQVESMFNLLFSVLVGLSVFIIGFALINLINTLITNILTRDHEFAMLQSVGMTRKQLSGMLRMEALILAGGNLLITLVIGTSAGYVMIKILRYFGLPICTLYSQDGFSPGMRCSSFSCQC